MPNIGMGTQAKYRSLLDAHILSAFDGLSLAGVTTQRIQTFLTQKRAAGLSWWSRSDLRNLLSGIFTVATKWNYRTRPNPVNGTDIGAKEWKRDNRTLTDDEVLAIIQALEAASDVWLIVETLVATGMRTSEIFGLK
jgi:integrase